MKNVLQVLHKVYPCKHKDKESPSKHKIQGTSSPPCGKSVEYLLCPVT